MSMNELQKQTNSNIQAKTDLGNRNPSCWAVQAHEYGKEIIIKRKAALRTAFE